MRSACKTKTPLDNGTSTDEAAPRNTADHDRASIGVYHFTIAQVDAHMAWRASVPVKEDQIPIVQLTDAVDHT